MGARHSTALPNRPQAKTASGPLPIAGPLALVAAPSRLPHVYLISTTTTLLIPTAPAVASHPTNTLTLPAPPLPTALCPWRPRRPRPLGSAQYQPSSFQIGMPKMAQIARPTTAVTAPREKTSGRRM